MLVFVVYTGLTLFLSEDTTRGSDHKAVVLEVAARQRTLTERYTKEVLLALEGSPSAAGPIAHDLKRSAAVLLDGGVAPEVAGDGDEQRVRTAHRRVGPEAASPGNESHPRSRRYRERRSSPVRRRPFPRPRTSTCHATRRNCTA